MADFNNLARDFGVKRNFSISPAKEKEVEGFEKQLVPPCVLPIDYRKFLLKYNGGSFTECVIADTAIGPVVAAQFYSLLEEDEYYIVRARNNLLKYVSENYVPVAVDPGGSYFLIDLSLSRCGAVDFWDHETGQFTNIADSFSNFIARLEVDL
jgi:hypothetical protein